MRGTSIPIRRIVRGTEWNRKPYKPADYPVSPAIESLLSEPTWSVRSLLPPSKQGATATPESRAAAQEAEKEITREKLHHLLKLSALPLPKSPAEESKMLQTLRDQVHFVKAIQAVDTTGVEPLITIRDETQEAIEEQTITLEKMMPYLELEEKVGQNGTVRRREVMRTPEQDKLERATWEIDVGDLGIGSERRRRGRFFYVKRSKEKKSAKDVVGDSEKATVQEKPVS